MVGGWTVGCLRSQIHGWLAGWLFARLVMCCLAGSQAGSTTFGLVQAQQRAQRGIAGQLGGRASLCVQYHAAADMRSWSCAAPLLGAGAAVMAPTLVLPSAHLGLSGGFAYTTEVRRWAGEGAGAAGRLVGWGAWAWLDKELLAGCSGRLSWVAAGTSCWCSCWEPLQPAVIPLLPALPCCSPSAPAWATCLRRAGSQVRRCCAALMR